MGGPERPAFGSGARTDIHRHFGDAGATVLRIESASRPGFLRVMAPGRSPHGLEGSTKYDNLNAGERNGSSISSTGRGSGAAAHGRMGRCRGRELHPEGDEGFRA